MNKTSLILASGSIRRHELLNQIGIDHEIYPSGIIEKLKPELNPHEMAIDLSYQKGLVVSQVFPDNIILSADTIIQAGNKILGKPENKKNSIEMIKSLSNNSHNVITGFTLIHKNKNITNKFYSLTKVDVLQINQFDIKKYVDENNLDDYSGSYAIQGEFAVWIKKIKGCYNNILGLPLSYFNEKYLMIKNQIYFNDL
tara:strand:+ start:956 stop:1549 length:594 start_codon:yes stop_codon:yes gene_type:complete